MSDTGDSQAGLTAEGASGGIPQPGGRSTGERLDLLQWHLERYDRLRASTSARASVVLSAGAILSAGNAVVLAQLLGGPLVERLPPWLLLVFAAVTVLSVGLVVFSLLQAAGVLVTLRPSREIFAQDEEVPAAPVFNGTDTVRQFRRFSDFRDALAEQGERETLEAAQVELWIGINQHRRRYAQLRSAVRLLRHSAVAFMAILVGAVIGNLLLQL